MDKSAEARIAEIRRIDPKFYKDRKLEEDEILHWFDLCDAYWMHDGNLARPHAELTSGKCSNGFFDCLRVLEYPNLCEILAHQLARKLQTAGEILETDWVIGSPYAAITFSYEVAKRYGATHGFAEKSPTDPNRKRMVWQRRTIPKGATVLQIEELITTSGTFQEVHWAVNKGNAEPVNFLPIVGALVHRPPELPVDYGNRQVIALIEKKVWAVESSECPLCQQGSKRLRPKTNWAELTEKAKK